MSHPKVVFLGAGSVVFSKNVIADMLWHDSMKEIDLRLVDIDHDRLDTASGMANKLNQQLGANATISATEDRRQGLDGVDFVINCIGVGGLPATEADLKIPLEFGVKQTVGDTLGIGGIFRSVRSIPVLLDICRDMSELCPDALLLNYTNPMAMHCLAVERTTSIKHVGLCHGVQNTAQTMRMITEMISERPEVIETHFDRPWGDAKRDEEWRDWMARGDDPDMKYTCAGINHMAFFLRFESKGHDLYPLLWKASEISHMQSLDPVRFELFRRLGYFMTETSGHTAEYVPYFLQRDEEIENMGLRVTGYLNTCDDQDKMYQNLRAAVKSGNDLVAAPYCLSKEYASRILNAVITDSTFVFNGNIHNRGGRLINNLPGDCCVEVPCEIDADGIHPVPIGDIPPQCAALIRTNVNVQDLAVSGIIEGDRDRIRQAAMMDPATTSQISLPKLDELMDAMFEAHAGRLPENLK